MIKKLSLSLLFIAISFTSFSQDDKKEEDESKMIREIISIEIDKGEPASDTGSPMAPAPVGEIIKRAHNWEKEKTTKYAKTNCAASGNKVTCHASFPYKVKELNPVDKVDGEIDMEIIVEAKEGKYRYTVKNIVHKATQADVSGGDIYQVVPACGSMKMTDLTWKRIKSAALADAKMVAEDLKNKMAQASEDGVKKDDW